MSSTATARVKWMRRYGATACTWSPDGQLLSATLGEAPPPPLEDDDPVQPRKLTAEARAEHARTELRRIALGASGGPVRRLREDFR